jgi:hypothetical protein
MLSACDLRLFFCLLHGVPVSVDDQSIHELRQGCHDFGPRSTIQ